MIESKPKSNVVVVGLGYVGLTLAIHLAEKELVGTFALAAERAVCGFKGEERIAAHLRLKMATQCIDAANALGLPTAAFEDVKRYFLP